MLCGRATELGSHIPLGDRQACLSGREGGNIDACVKILDGPPEKTSSEQGEVFSYPSRRLGISSDFGLYLITVGVSHHALACIHLRLDDIQHVVLVIYKTPF